MIILNSVYSMAFGKSVSRFQLAITLVTVLILTLSSSVSGQKTVYRYYNPIANKHYWSTGTLPGHLKGYQLDGAAFYTGSSGVPVYRFYNPTTDKYFWTTTPEHENLGGYRKEGIAFYGASQGVPVYRYYNPSKDIHLWTKDPAHEHLGGYNKEGIAFYSIRKNGAKPRPGRDPKKKKCSYSNNGVDNSGKSVQEVHSIRRHKAIEYCRGLGGVNWAVSSITATDGWRSARDRYVGWKEDISCNCK